MHSLRDHLDRTPEVRSRNLAAWMAPALGLRATPMSPRFFEEAAFTVLAHVLRDAGPIHEVLTLEHRRFDQLVYVLHRLPNRGGEG